MPHFQPQIFVPQHLIVGNHAVYQTGIHCLMKRNEIKAGLMVYKQDIGRLYLRRVVEHTHFKRPFCISPAEKQGSDKAQKTTRFFYLEIVVALRVAL